MTDKFTLTAGDTAPSLQRTLSDPTPDWDLAGATVTFNMTSIPGGTQIIDDGPCVIVDAPTKVVRYDWRAGIDTIYPDFYHGQFKAVLADGSEVTFPNDGYILIVIQASLDAVPPAGPVPGQASDDQLRAWAADPDGHLYGTLTRDANEAVIGGSWLWDDGTIGVFTGTASSGWPGAIDSYTVTYGSKLLTQPAVTRDTKGAVTVRPEIVVS